HVIDSSGIHVDPAKIEAIKSWAAPKKSDGDEGPSDPLGLVDLDELVALVVLVEMRMELVSEAPDRLRNRFMSMFEKLESVFQISECKEKDKVKFAMATLRGRALTWWNGRTKAMAANNTPWSEVKKWMTEEFCPRCVIQRMEQELYNLRMKGMDIDGYNNRFHELALMCLRMVEPEAVKVEQYI
nr:putative reverse transcriptase domain-containing protein [Tanacetum cinerariifolium]